MKSPKLLFYKTHFISIMVLLPRSSGCRPPHSLDSKYGSDSTTDTDVDLVGKETVGKRPFPTHQLGFAMVGLESRTSAW
jgi:hypothetical protein